MERVLGIGGVFFKAHAPATLASWYQKHLGLPIETGQTNGTLRSTTGGEATVWSTFPDDTNYFGSKPTNFMINFRVRDLDAMLDQLRVAGVEVDEHTEDHDYGRFGWAYDPEGNRIELWQPK